MTAGATLHDVAIVGDGPAGSALAAACVAAGLDVVLVGPDRPWTAILAAWADELPPALLPCIRETATAIDVVGRERRRLDRSYATIDVTVLRPLLRAPVGDGRHAVGSVERIWHTTQGSRLALDDGSEVGARLVVDATGLPSALRPHAASARGVTGWQTAYGLVLDHRPRALDGEVAVLMDWRRPGGTPATRAATFLYVVPLVSGRWLVEETSLRSRIPVGAEELRARLAARLGADLTDQADHVEHVRIVMPPGVPARSDPVVGFGAAARYGHPATGYSVAASLRAAAPVAAVVSAALGAGLAPRRTALAVWNAAWPAGQRATRALHDIGAAALDRLAPDDVADFFDTFFALPEQRWSDYLRIDAPPAAVAAAMRDVFSSAPWALRRRMAASLPAPLLGSPLRRVRP